eukprot:1024754-Prorocentrum_lima.AAC.1
MSWRKGPTAKRKVTRWTTPVPLAMARSTSARQSFAFRGVVTDPWRVEGPWVGACGCGVVWC